MISDVPDRHRDRRAHRARAGGAVVAAIAVTAIAFGGCGGGGDEGGGGTTTTSAAAPTTTSSQSATTSTTSTTSTGSGSGDGQGGQTHTTIRQVVDAVLTSADPEKACRSQYVTEHYLATAYGGKQGCVQAQSSTATADSVHFGEETMRAILDGTAQVPREATAKVVPDGGLYGGDQITVSLVREDRSWKVDKLKSNAPVGP